MKTLDQIEPRRLINKVPTVITNTGAYYLTTNLVSTGSQPGITIEADNVTLDLNGFALIGNEDADAGVLVPERVNALEIRDGTIRNWNVGVMATNAVNSDVRDLTVERNRVTGIALGVGAVLRGCRARRNGIAKSELPSNDGQQEGEVMIEGAGLVVGTNSWILECRAVGNGRDGIRVRDGSRVEGVESSRNGGHGLVGGNRVQARKSRFVSNGKAGLVLGDSAEVVATDGINNGQEGIKVGGSGRVMECTARSNARAGIVLGDAGLVSRGLSSANGADGILVASRCTVVDNACKDNFNARDAAGIRATGTDNTIRNNDVAANDRGISAESEGNLIVGNTAANNTLNYFTPAKQTMGPIISGPNLESVNNPWANFAY